GVMEFCAQYVLFLAVLILLPLWTRPNGLRPLVAVVVGAVLGILVSKTIGHVWYEQRPFVAYHFTPLVAHSADASFPSDHLIAFGVMTVCAWYGWKRLGIAMAVAGVVVAFARVYIGVHYVGDVVGGAVIGAACGGIALWITGLPQVKNLIEWFDGKLHAWELRRV
ncbi:MAG: phosphatase PAP2 family protein, partial [Candidatus Dormibacteria bacterium]